MKTITLSEWRPPLSPLYSCIFRLCSGIVSHRIMNWTKNGQIKTFGTSSFECWFPVSLSLWHWEHHQHLLPASSICDFLFISFYCHYNLYALDDFYVVVLRFTFSVSFTFFLSFSFVFFSLFLVVFYPYWFQSSNENDRKENFRFVFFLSYVRATF